MRSYNWSGGSTGTATGTVYYRCSSCGATTGVSFSSSAQKDSLLSTTFACSASSSVSYYYCPTHGGTYYSPGTCTQSVTCYTCPTHGGNYSSSGSCTSKVSYTYYTMNCGFW